MGRPALTPAPRFVASVEPENTTDRGGNAVTAVFLVTSAPLGLMREQQSCSADG